MNLDNESLKEEGTKARNLISVSQPRWYLNCIWHWEASALRIVSFLPVSVWKLASLLLFAVCCLFHLLCDVCVDSMTLLAKHDCSWVVHVFGEHLHFLLHLLLLFLSPSWSFFCVLYWCLMLSASDWEDCHWCLVLSIMNLFLSTSFLMCYSRRHLVSFLGSW